MNSNEFLLKSLVSIILLLTCQFESINGLNLEVKCASNSSDTCVVYEAFNGNDESIKLVTTPEQDNNTIYGLHLMNVHETIPNVFFQRFPEIKYAVIKANVETITANTFNDAKNLRNLFLEGNRLKVLPKEVFVNTALKWLDLSSNVITDIEDDAFSGTPKLIFIQLNKNNLTIIRKATFSGATALMRLELEDNQIEMVEQGAFDIETLKVLFMESNRLKQLPDDIFKNAPFLAIAYFSSNGMTEIGRAFYNAKKLESVGFRHNLLKDVDLYDFVKGNPYVRNMYMEDTGFSFRNSEARDEKFENQLCCLYLTNNNISNSNFLSHLTAFKDLDVLDIAFNNITQIDGIETIHEKFPKLKMIIYPGNPLSCSWIESTPFDRKLFFVPIYHESGFNVSDYSQVDGIYCKK